jgi:hypothetical protein
VRHARPARRFTRTSTSNAEARRARGRQRPRVRATEVTRSGSRDCGDRMNWGLLRGRLPHAQGIQNPMFDIRVFARLDQLSGQIRAAAGCRCQRGSRCRRLGRRLGAGSAFRPVDCSPPPPESGQSQPALAPRTPPGVRVRTGRFAQHSRKRR